ncbi:DUF6287 domain-containing protein [Streptococcus cristatus]|jgi:hypothetical protein|uniref:DUF6287 domain-containing protein n=1 Tax=Streptococcus cristatus TaxID=45634 RepID=A0A3R9LTC4_STRCR|nr:DUF6287 domain-containing protein [Streptococcus cristatus]RSJ80673.1 hypothetical protein D8791_08085 [Streptococcus cristatus]
MKRSKFILLTATALCSAFLLAACSSKPSTKVNSSSTSQTSKTSSLGESSTKPSAKQSSASNSVTSSSTPQTSSDQGISSQAEKPVENKTSADSNTSPTPATPVAPTTSGMDINALANGDFSSITGTWQDDLGNQLVFDANGLVSHTYRGNESSDYTLTNSQVYEGKFGAFLTHKSGNQVASFTAIPKGARLYDTGSQNPKERILVGQDFTYASQHPYYRVAN